MNWEYADKYKRVLSYTFLTQSVVEQAMQIEALVKIAEQLEQLNKNLMAIKKSEMKVKVSGGINTHPY